MPTLDLEAPEALSPSTLISWLGQLPEPCAHERRMHERLSAQELAWLKSARLRFGAELTLIDLSAGGALFETRAPLRPGSAAVLTLTGRGVDETASFHVLRCEVSSLEQGLTYRGACAFDQLIQLPSSSPARDAVVVQDAGPTEEEVLEVIQAIAGRNSGPAGIARPRQLLEAIRAAVERGYSPASLLRGVEREFTAGIRPLPPPLSAPPAAIDVGPDAAFPSGAGARPMSAPGWNKLVVRFLDGTVLKGFSQNFHPARAQFHLAGSIAGGDGKTSLIAMDELKAVFFVRDFDGDPDYVDSRSFAERTPGKRIEVTFADGELLVGSTLGYRPDRSGFFVRPADGDGNNLRVFVLPAAVRRVRYL
jgi:hypothetical protein